MSMVPPNVPRSLVLTPGRSQITVAWEAPLSSGVPGDWGMETEVQPSSSGNLLITSPTAGSRVSDPFDLEWTLDGTQERWSIVVSYTVSVAASTERVSTNIYDSNRLVGDEARRVFQFYLDHNQRKLVGDDGTVYRTSDGWSVVSAVINYTANFGRDDVSYRYTVLLVRSIKASTRTESTTITSSSANHSKQVASVDIPDGVKSLTVKLNVLFTGGLQESATVNVLH